MIPSRTRPSFTPTSTAKRASRFLGADMPIQVLMPALSPTMEKGNLAKWLKKEGETIKTGDVIAEIETDKATMEYEAIEDGVLAKIVVPEGTSDVPVNQLIAVMAQEGEDPKAAASAAAEKSPQGRAPSSPPSPAKGEGAAAQAAAASNAAPTSSAAKSSTEPKTQVAPSPPAGEGGDEGARPLSSSSANGRANRVFASPLAPRLAKDAGIDL